MASFLREADKRMLDDFCDKMEDCRKFRKISYLKLAALSRVQLTTVQNMIIGQGGTIRTVLRLIDAMDYDIILVKRRESRNPYDTQGYAERLYEMRKYAAQSKRKSRGEVRSLRQEITDAEFEEDFLNT